MTSHRRDLLKYLGLAGLLPVASRAQAAAAPKKRFFGFYMQNGITPKLFRAGRRASETDFDFPEIYAPLTPIKSDLVLLDSVENKAGRQMFVHYIADTTTYTGFSAGNNAPKSGGPSFDQVLAAKIGAANPFSSLTLGVRETHICWNSAGLPVRLEQSPLRAYQRLFPSDAMAGAPSAADRLRLNRSVLDALSADGTRALDGLPLDSRPRVEQYMDALRAYEKQLKILAEAAANPVMCMRPGAPMAMEPTNDFLNAGSSAPQLLALQRDLIISAFACGLTRVATLGFGCGGMRFSFLEGPATRVDLHLMGHEGDYPGQTGVFRYVSTVFADIVARLKATPSPEGDGSLFDNTLLTWFTDAAENHFMDYITTLIAAGKNIGLRTGRHVRIPVGTHSLNDLFVSLGNLMGLPLDTFGEARFCKGPVAGLI